MGKYAEPILNCPLMIEGTPSGIPPKRIKTAVCIIVLEPNVARAGSNPPRLRIG